MIPVSHVPSQGCVDTLRSIRRLLRTADSELEHMMDVAKETTGLCS